VAFEAAQRLFAALAFELLARQVGASRFVKAGLADRDAMEREVELAVAAAVEAVAVGASRGGRDRCGRSRARELCVRLEALDARGLADDLGGGQHAAAVELQQLGRVGAHRRAELALEPPALARELAQTAQLLAHDPHACALLGAPQLARDQLEPLQPPTMPSAELTRRVEKVVGYPPLSELSDLQRHEFHEALLDAGSFEDLPGGGRRRSWSRNRTGLACASCECFARATPPSPRERQGGPWGQGP
jgi:hypothetical protein